MDKPALKNLPIAYFFLLPAASGLAAAMLTIYRKLLLLTLWLRPKWDDSSDAAFKYLAASANGLAEERAKDRRGTRND